jgi:hypothetical protein
MQKCAPGHARSSTQTDKWSISLFPSGTGRPELWIVSLARPACYLLQGSGIDRIAPARRSCKAAEYHAQYGANQSPLI